MLPVVGVRLLEGRCGSTLLMQLLATAPEIVMDRRYPEGEYRYLAYCQRTAQAMARPLRAGIDPGVTELIFGDPDRFGPLPFEPTSLDREELGQALLQHMWRACSELMIAQQPDARWYAEKLAYPVGPLVDAALDLVVIDLIRDPRDMLASIRSFVDRTGVSGFGIDGDGPRTSAYVESFIARLQDGLDQMARPPQGFRRLLIRYEDLVGDLAGFAGALGDALDVHIDAVAVANGRASMAHHTTTPSLEASMGRWRADLTASEADLIWTELGPRLEPLGYTR